jgi:hypothetical protein
MKPIYLTIFFALCWLPAIIPEQFSVWNEPVALNGHGDTTLVKRLVTPNFNVLIQRVEDGDDIYAVITTINGQGLKIDQKTLVETRWRLDSGCHRQQEHGDYEFKSNRKFIFTLKTMDAWCGLERQQEETNSQYLDRLMLVEDPYQVPAHEMHQLTVEHYDIDEAGKINVGNVHHSIPTDNWLSLGRFDLLPNAKLALMRNTIFAQKGYKFKTQELKEYFSKKPWYVPKHDNIAAFLSASDKKLIDYLERLENR